MKKLKHSITIGITDNDQCVVSVNPELEASLALQLLGTLALHLLNAYYQAAQGSLNLADKDSAIALTGIKESMYDAADNVFSSVLAQFYPEAPRMSIEDEAILELTNKLINEIMVPATAAVIIRANRSQPSVGAIAVKVLPIKKTVINSIRSLYRFQLLVKVVIIGVLIA